MLPKKFHKYIESICVKPNRFLIFGIINHRIKYLYLDSCKGFTLAMQSFHFAKEFTRLTKNNYICTRKTAR